MASNSTKEAQMYLNEKIDFLNKAANTLLKAQKETKNISDQEGFTELKSTEQAKYIVQIAQCVENMTVAVEEQCFWTNRMNNIVAEVE